MAPARPYWKGYLKLSLVSCPIALYTGTSSTERVSFRQINKKTGNRLRHQLVDDITREPVEAHDKGRGYEYSKNAYIPVDDDELDAIAIESNHTIEIDSFVPREQIDERYLDGPYYITPNDQVGQDAFAVIREAMRDKGMVALARVVLSKRERVIMLEPWDKGLMGTTLRYPYEIRDSKEYFDDIPDVKVEPDMLKLAEHILQSKAADFDPSQFADHYEEAVVEMLKKKQAGLPVSREHAAPRPQNVVNLMDALRRSIAEEKAASAPGARVNMIKLASHCPLRRDRHRKSALPEISKIVEVRRGLLHSFLEPSLASMCDTPPSGAKWVHEIKYDGYRMQARIDGGDVRLLTRKNLDWTRCFRSIAVALKELRVGSAQLDGEIVVEDANGISSFNELQSDLKAGRQDRFAYHVFDIHHCDGFDLTQATLVNRKALLQQLISALPANSPIRFCEHLEEDGRTTFEHARKLGLEGIVSKRKDLPYRPGRGEHWLKSKCAQRQEFVILGYVPSTTASGSVGSVLVGYQDKGKLIYAGRVGTGWSMDQARLLRADIEKVSSIKPTLGKKLPAGAEKGVCWAEPRLLCEIEYRGWTHNGLLRTPSFKGLREDKPPQEIVLEAPHASVDRGGGKAERPRTSTAATTPSLRTSGRAGNGNECG